MSSHNSSSCFISYVDLSSDNDEIPDPILQPILNKGEVIIAEALNVFRMDTISESPENLLGSLFVTNFRLTFKPTDSKPDDVASILVRFMDEFDVCLSMIDFIYVVDDKKKRLLPRQNVKERIPELMILCKNMRRLTFNFSLSQIDQGKQVTNALLYHAYPIKHELLFAYDFQGSLLSGIDLGTILFRRAIDWERELKRTKCRNWRVTRINENFLISNKMPQSFVVPSTLLDFYLSEIVDNFSNQFLPVWCWGNKIGVALVRMAELVQTTGDRTPENIVLEHIRKSHNWRVQPTIISLNDDHYLSTKNIRQKFLKFRKLFAPKSQGEFWAHDNNFFSLLDHSDWLKIISLCLKKAVDVVDLLANNITVVLQEKNGQDISCVISSLMQIIWDPYWRTINGFQSLIQKEWIAFGHPFSNRLGHTYSKEDEKSPILLVFFDCVWQLIRQYPFAFEFTDNYLIFLWDYAHLTIFDTFLFDSEYDRYAAVEKDELKLHSFWQWITEHPESSTFQNVFYDIEKCRMKLDPSYQMYDLEIWMQNYCRWLPLLKSSNENRNSIEEQIRNLFNEVELLKMANSVRCSSKLLTTTYLK